jgi:hypothetical protein
VNAVQTKTARDVSTPLDMTRKSTRGARAVDHKIDK